MKTSVPHTLKSLLEEGFKYDGESRPKSVPYIFVPKIQRAYAQGRNEEQDIRNEFLRNLFDILTAKEEKTIELGFLFGSLQNLAKETELGKKSEHKETEPGFELLDGQQRVTTLFLLYWYIGKREGRDISFLSRFTYDTRETSTQFLKKITAKEFDLDNQTPSHVIKNKIWFTEDFYCDPTICAMLTMLDAIHDLYKSLKRSDLFSKIERLRFYVLIFEKFDRNDELYIKMNSRGLRLVPFENFKASIEKYMNSNDRNGIYKKIGNDGKPFWLDFMSDIDSRWIEFFWSFNPKYPKKEYTLPKEKRTKGKKNNAVVKSDDEILGERYLNLMNRYFYHKSVLVDGSTSKFFIGSDNEKGAESEKMKKRFFGWENYEQLFKHYEKDGQIESTIFFKLRYFLNTLMTHGKVIEEIIMGVPYTPITSMEGFLFKTNKFTLADRFAFAAIAEFLEHIPADKNIEAKEIRANFKRLLRVVFNIVENTSFKD